MTQIYAKCHNNWKIDNFVTIRLEQPTSRASLETVTRSM